MEEYRKGELFSYEKLVTLSERERGWGARARESPLRASEKQKALPTAPLSPFPPQICILSKKLESELAEEMGHLH